MKHYFPAMGTVLKFHKKTETIGSLDGIIIIKVFVKKLGPKAPILKSALS